MMQIQFQHSGIFAAAKATLLVGGLLLANACGSNAAGGQPPSAGNTTQQGTTTASDSNSSGDSNTTAASNSNSATSVSTTQAAQLAAAATQMTDPNTGAFVSQSAQTPACQQLAAQVTATITKTMQDMNQMQDCTADLQAFITEISQLAQCMDSNATGAAGLPFSPNAIDVNNCNTMSDSNGVVVTACSAGALTCSTQSDQNGVTTQSCSSDANGLTAPNPTNPTVADPNQMTGMGNTNVMGTPTMPATTQSPNTMADGNMLTLRALAATNGQACTTQRTPQGALRVTCQCSVASGTCKKP